MIMKKNLFFAAMAIALASCASDDFVGENNNSPNPEKASDAIVFSSGTKAVTRGDIYGSSAATLLGNNFYVTGTKGTEADDSPTPTLVFDNYLVHYGVNTAGTTESNTSNWEYVGVTPGISPYENYVKLSSLNSQTIKYWDYSEAQYDFLAFSTGTYKAGIAGDESTKTIGVTAMKYGTDLANSSVAYTFKLPSENALKNAFISDITEVVRDNYGKEVQLKFKSLGSKVRVALYETVPGYSVKGVQFYTVDDDGTHNFEDNKGTDAALISAAGIPTKGEIDVIFPLVGNDNAGKEAYNKASATVRPGSDAATYKTFGALTNQLVAKEAYEAGADNVFLGRTLPTASFAGVAAENFYLNLFPVSTPAPLTLRVDYTLVPIDGAAETIVVKGAKAVVPATYTTWLPNYAYTYIFKISDNTNGWTGAANKPSGLFPITFDAVVTEATDATAEQKTITTVATPTITTYQQNHDITKDEYSKATAKNIYVQVMDNSGTTATLKNDLNGDTPDDTKKSLLFAVTSSGKTYNSEPVGWPSGYYTDAAFTTAASGTFSTTTTYYKRCTEADVMDALENQSKVDAGVITGRNTVILTPASINAGVTSIVNGVDNVPITVSAGQAAEIAYTLAAGTYAYVYDYSAAAKNTTTIYQPIAVTENAAIGTSGETFLSVATSVLNGIDTSVAGNVTTEGEAVNKNFIYFSKTKNGGTTWIYSFVSVDGKATLPAGLVKCPVSSLTADVAGTTNAVAGTFYFTTYVRNDGSYAVKIIKIVA